MPYWVYILKCADGSLYTGITNNLVKRVAVHNAGKGAKYTRARLPVILKYSVEVEDRGSALKEEYRIKQLSKTEKDQMCNELKINHFVQ